MNARDLNNPELMNSKSNTHPYNPEFENIMHSSSSHIFNVRKKTVLCIPPFVLDDVGNLNDPELAQSLDSIAD
jgi:hypothetical protein